MSFLNSDDRLEILLALSDQLWSDYDNNEILDFEYIRKMDQIRIEINREIDLTFKDVQKIGQEIGYLILKKTEPFTIQNKFTVVRN